MAATAGRPQRGRPRTAWGPLPKGGRTCCAKQGQHDAFTAKRRLVGRHVRGEERERHDRMAAAHAVCGIRVRAVAGLTAPSQDCLMATMEETPRRPRVEDVAALVGMLAVGAGRALRPDSGMCVHSMVLLQAPGHGHMSVSARDHLGCEQPDLCA